ncbi:MAG: sulfatase-like hydrolase/transferase [Cyclobacteriaceae bacterium]|nr:sulfatase-like hydrolase/transferase [Cyclobacteriaceae bacterium]
MKILSDFKFIYFILVANTYFIVSGCHSNKEKNSVTQPNIIWINVEDINPALGCYGDPNAITPNLDKLASEGIVYKNAYSTAPICAPSRSSFVTGVYSTSMGTQHLRSRIDKPDFIKTLPEHLKDAGYFVTNYAKTDWNFSADGVFDYWKQDLAPWRHRPVDKPFYSTFVIGGTHEGAANREDIYQRQTDGLPKENFHNPDGFPVPAFYPDTPHFQKMWAKYYDLITRMDMIVGEIMDNLEEDGLKDETIVFFFSDHGFGMPRFKRYLFHSGVHVPLLVYIPEKYKHLSNNRTAGSATDQLVSLVDLAPSVLNMLGIEKPEYIQGQAFLGTDPEPVREFIYTERSRADDLFDMSRAIFDGQYMYIRHYMPYLPWIREGTIQGEESGKESYEQLHRLYAIGGLSAAMEKLFHPKPYEELYDLKADPWEMDNIIDRNEHKTRVTKLKKELARWSLFTRDIGFMPEAEYMIQSEGSSPYEIAQNDEIFPIDQIMQAANLAGSQDVQGISQALNSQNPVIVYWGIIASRSLETPNPRITEAIRQALNSPSPSTCIAAAEALCAQDECNEALSVLEKWILDERPWVSLQAARSLVEIGPKAKPVLPAMYEAQKLLFAGEGGTRKYKDFEYASFTGWALERAIINCGENPL